MTIKSCYLFAILGITTAAILFLSFPRPAPAANLSGNILLQVQSRGEAWYVNPSDGRRYYLKDGPTAFSLMRSLGLGISESDYSKLASGNAALRKSVMGKIVLRVHARGEAYFLCPRTGTLSYLKDGAAAFSVMRQCGLGITNANLAKIAVSSKSVSPASSSPVAHGCAYSNPSCDAQNQCVENKCTPKSGCAYNNPSCGNILTCVNNACVAKPPAAGCNFDNPACSSSQNCINNACVDQTVATGCAYGNPSCSANQICVNNACVDAPAATGCANSNPVCDASHDCINNSCVLKSGCAYSNPICSSTQGCVNNVCTDNVSSCATPVCMETRVATLYQATDAGAITSKTLNVGDTMPLGSTGYIRVESMGANNTDPVVTVWNNSDNGCALFDKMYVYQGAISPYILGPVFFTISNDGSKMQAIVYTGGYAYNACTTHTTSYLNVQCASLPNSGRYTLADGVIRRIFKNSNFEPAESLALDIRNFDYQRITAIFPALSIASSPDGKWVSTEFTTQDTSFTFAGFADAGKTYDLEQGVWQQTLSTDLSVYNAVKSSLGNLFTWPASVYTSITTGVEDHELSHSMFWNTQIQEFVISKYPTLVGEGLADYIEGYSMWPKNRADQYKNDLKCGETTHGDEQTLYTSDYSTSYYAGECFYYLVADACGTSGMNAAFADALNQPYHPHDIDPTWFGMLYKHCSNQDRFKQILTNFGIPLSVLDAQSPLMPGLLPGNACSAS